MGTKCQYFRCLTQCMTASLQCSQKPLKVMEENKTKQKKKTDEGIHLKTKAVAEKKTPKNGRMINKKKKKKQNSYSAVVYGNQRGGEKHKRKHKQN